MTRRRAERPCRLSMQGKPRMSWSDERVELLKRLWGEGQSASQIAKELGGVTRNAVIGKVHRLGLSNRNGSATAANTGSAAAPDAETPKAAAKPAPKAAAKPASPAEAPEDEAEPATARAATVPAARANRFFLYGAKLRGRIRDNLAFFIGAGVSIFSLAWLHTSIKCL